MEIIEDFLSSLSPLGPEIQNYPTKGITETRDRNAGEFGNKSNKFPSRRFGSKGHLVIYY